MTTTSALPASTPRDQGVDARGVLALLDALEAHPDIDPHGLVVVRGGRTVAQGWWAPYERDAPHLLYSLSKSFTSTALGLAVAEGLVSLDDTVLSHFPELDAEVSDPRSRAIRLRHVAAMASGHTQDMIHLAHATDPLDLVRGFLLNPPEREPGSVFAYDQPCTFSIGAVVARASGTSLTGYLRPRVLDPLGIGEVAWTVDASGREIAFSGLHAPTEAVAKLGLLYAQHGAWQGRQLLDPAWVAEATRSHVSTEHNDTPDWQQGYGFQFWTSRHGYRGDGAYGQFALVLPEHDAVVAITSGSTDTQALLDAVWDHLLPALAPGASTDAAADAELAARLGRLALPALAGAAEPAGAAAWDGADVAVAADTGGPLPQRVRVHRSPGGWRLELVEGDDALAVPFGSGAWTTSEAAGALGGVPVAASGGWGASGALAVDVLFLHTPHRLRLTCSSPDGELAARWVTTPLSAHRLAELRAPSGASVHA